VRVSPGRVTTLSANSFGGAEGVGFVSGERSWAGVRGRNEKRVGVFAGSGDEGRAGGAGEGEARAHTEDTADFGEVRGLRELAGAP
jgi:hypothetical protein